MILYHGSEKIIKKPLFGYGRTDNDYGQGFYCTEDVVLAREWACKDNTGGFVNTYQLPAERLRILDLKPSDVVSWLTLLIHNRHIRYDSPIERQTAEYLIAHYLPDISGYDVIRGYRADDSYFTYVRAFLSNTISLQQLSQAMRFGNLGIQFFLKSRKAFDQIQFIESAPVNGEDYYPRRKNRDAAARQSYYRLLEQAADNGTYARDIIHGGLNADELRLS